MDLPWGDDTTQQFITNVGIVSSNGPNGQDIMACEWTHHISYSPGLIAICLGFDKATLENIRATKEFGVSIAAKEQSVLSSMSGMSSGHDVDKIKVCEELGFSFYKAKKIDVLMVKDAALNVECKLFKEIELGDHVMMVGEVIDTDLSGKTPIAYHKGRYGEVNFSIAKPSDKEREEFKKIVEKYKK